MTSAPDIGLAGVPPELARFDTHQRGPRSLRIRYQRSETEMAAILAALQITDELFKARAGDEATAARMRSLSGELRRWLPPAKRVPGAPVPEEA